MLDITLLRKDLAGAVARLDTRKSPQAFLDVEAFSRLEAERKTIQMRTEELQSQRNPLSLQSTQSSPSISPATRKAAAELRSPPQA